MLLRAIHFKLKHEKILMFRKVDLVAILGKLPIALHHCEKVPTHTFLVS